MFLKIDGTFVVQLINFAVFFAILNVVFIRPVGKSIVKRRQYINSVTSDYDRYQAEAASLRTQAEAVRSAARREAETHLSKERAKASNESASLAAEYAAQASQAIAQADRTVSEEMQAARQTQPQLAGELAKLMVERAMPQAAT